MSNLTPAVLILALTAPPQDTVRTNLRAAPVTTNEPVGFSQLTYRPFHRKPGAETRISPDIEDGWYDRPGPNSSVIGPDEIPPELGTRTAPSAPSVAQFRFPRGQKWGAAPVSVGKTWEPVRSVYVSFWIQLSRNAGDSKICYLHWGDAFTFYLSTGGRRSPPHQRQSLAIFIQGGAPSLGGNEPGGGQRIDTHAPLTPGKWHLVELLLTTNSSRRAADGALVVWVDGRKRTERTNMAYIGGNKRGARDGITGIRFNPTYAQAAKVPNPIAWYMWIDDVYVSGR